MKPSLNRVRAKMGKGGAISKEIVMREIQRIISCDEPHTPEVRGMLKGMMYVFSGKDLSDINDDINDLYDETMR